MNKKGATVGFFVVAAITVLVAVALFVQTADITGDMTNLRSVVNGTYTTAATANGTITLPGRAATTSITVVNATDGTVWSSNFTLVEEDANGDLAVLLKTTDAAVAAGQNGTSVNVSYTYEPYGYNSNNGARSMVVIILIMAALGIAFVLIPGLRETLGEFMNK